MADLVFTQTTTAGITVYVQNLDPSYSRNDRYIEWYLTVGGTGGLPVKSDVPTQYIGPYITSTSPVTITKIGATQLNAGVQYGVWAYIAYTTDPAGTQWSTISVVGVTPPLTAGATRPPYFNWTYPKVSGNNFYTTATEWNSLTSNLNAVRAYKGQPSLSFTTVYSGNNFSAEIFNQVAYGINSIPGYANSIGTVVSGEEVYALYLNSLTYVLNSIS